MLILPPEDVAGALSWMTTDAFNSLGMSALAVILAGPEHCELLRHLEEQCRSIDHEGEDILILSLGSGQEPLAMLNPLWSRNPRSELVYQISEVREKLTGPYRAGTPWGTFTDAALRLLDLEPSCLPAVYMRFAETRGGGRPNPAVVVPLPRTRPELASRFLKELSWCATDHAAGYHHLSLFLSDKKRFGWVISKETQVALDESFREASRRCYATVAASHKDSERQRVQLAMDVTITQLGEWKPSFSDIVREADRFLAPTRIRSPTTFNRPDLAIAITTAAAVYSTGDFGTVVRNVGATLEAFFNASLLHLVRGAWNVRLPGHLEVVDPEAGPVEVNGVKLNHPRKETIGAPAAATGRNPWLAPSLSWGTQAFECWLQEKAPSEVNRSSCAAIVSLLQSVAPIRNPASHGDIITDDEAKRVWQLFEHFILSGEAAAMSAVRDGFAAWPQIDWSVFGQIREDPRPKYEQALNDEREASHRYLPQHESLDSLRSKIRPWQTAIDDLSYVTEAANPSLKELVTLPSAIVVSSELPSWTDVTAHLAASTESDRQAKALAKSASSFFTTRSAADRRLLAEVSKALTPNAEGIRSSADIDGVMSKIETILSPGTVIPKSATDWRPRIRARLERWLEALGTHSTTHELAMPGAAKALASAWIDVLKAKSRELEPAVREAEARVADAKQIRDCAVARLQAARIGNVSPCCCGRHSP